MTRPRTAPRPRVTALAVAAALALVASACTGTSGDDDEAAHATERAEGSPEEGEDMTDVDRAAEAYVAGYPLLVSLRTMQQLGGLLGVNSLFWQSELSGPQNRVVVAPNRDTLYSIAVLDLRAEPMALTLPEVTDRYFTYQFLDTWTESFAYVGTRATGGRAGTWVVVPPDWEGEVPDGAEVLESSTPLVFMLGRFLVDDEADVAEVTAISEQVTLQPLSALTGGEAPPPPPPLGEAPGTAQAIPTDASFFDELGDALAVNPPPTPAQRDFFARVEPLGVGPGENPAAAGRPEQVEVLDAGAARGDERIGEAMAARGDIVDGWAANLDVGRYGDDLDLRAVVARVGWGANIPEEAVYPVARADAEGKPLDGSSTYRITFPPGEVPPVDAFWSLSVYGGDMFFVEHPSGRYAIGDRTPDLAYGRDGSLELVLSVTEPAAPAGGGPVNWLPVPDGPFVLMLRLYLPGPRVRDGDYAYPPVERIDP
jgi:hypothetical protein